MGIPELHVINYKFISKNEDSSLIKKKRTNEFHFYSLKWHAWDFEIE